MALEIEIKSLLGTKAGADIFRQKLFEASPKAELVYKGKSVNHYFINPTDFDLFVSTISKLYSKNQVDSLREIVFKGKDLSIRTRETEDGVFLVVKASVDNTTSTNGVARLEFEEKVGVSLVDLDRLIISSGLEYQAKWSRAREQYKRGEFNICLDKNAGYGYIAEFELMVDDTDDIDAAKKNLKDEARKFGLVELDHARLARMFDYYNMHWPEYYGTEKVFNIA
jgi:predicted adenylyl cyclase CyaB